MTFATSTAVADEKNSLIERPTGSERLELVDPPGDRVGGQDRPVEIRDHDRARQSVEHQVGVAERSHRSRVGIVRQRLHLPFGSEG